MKFNQLYNILPNGLHDACIKNIQILPIEKIIDLDVNAWIGDLESKEFNIREKRTFAKVKICCHELIVPKNFNSQNCINSDMDSGLIDDVIRSKYNTGTTDNYLYFHGINDLIFFACLEIKIFIKNKNLPN